MNQTFTLWVHRSSCTYFCRLDSRAANDTRNEDWNRSRLVYLLCGITLITLPRAHLVSWNGWTIYCAASEEGGPGQPSKETLDMIAKKYPTVARQEVFGCKGNQAVSDGKPTYGGSKFTALRSNGPLANEFAQDRAKLLWQTCRDEERPIGFRSQQSLHWSLYLRLKVRKESILSMILWRKGQLHYTELPHKHTRQESGNNNCFSDCTGGVKGHLRRLSFLREI